MIHALTDCSVAVFLFDAAGDNLGLAHAPRPVEPGDVLALADGPPLRVTLLVQLPAEGVIEALAEVEPLRAELRHPPHPDEQLTG
jgi:hypothetical protein